MPARVTSFQPSRIKLWCPLEGTGGREIDTHLAQPSSRRLLGGQIVLPSVLKSPKEIPVARAVNTVSCSISTAFTIFLPGVIGFHRDLRAALFSISRKSGFRRQ